MASIELVKGSDGTGNASVATVQNTRSGGASTIIVDTVLGINAAGFAGTMGTPHTFTDPITSETITVISEATAVDFTGHVDGSNLEIDDIAPGYVDNGSAVGDIVIIRPTTQWADEVAAILEVAHADNGSIATDTIAEKTATAGVTVDGLLIKDGYPKALAKDQLTTDSNPYKFSVYRNSAQSSSTTNVKVAFDTEVFDTNSNFDSTTNHRYVAPVAGFYHFDAAIMTFVSDNVASQSFIYVNGSLAKTGSYAFNGTGGAANISSTVSSLLQLAANDYVEIFTVVTSGTPAINVGATTTYFMGFLMSRT